MKRFLVGLIILIIGWLLGYNSWKMMPLYKDKLKIKAKGEISAFEYEKYKDHQYGKEYYFQTAFKAYGKDNVDRKYLIFVMLFSDEKFYQGRFFVRFPMECKWIWQNLIDKFFGRKKEYTNEIYSVNEYGDFIVFKDLEWQKKYSICDK